MKIATVVELEASEVLDAIAEKAKASLPKEHVGGLEIAVRFSDDGKVTGATVTFNGIVKR